MGLKENLDFAQHAVNHVRTLRTPESAKIGIRAVNQTRKTPMPRTEEDELIACIGIGPDQYRQTSVRGKFAMLCRNVAGGRDYETCMQQMPEAMDQLAAYATQAHCGNCQEQDAVAIKFLKGKGVRPLDFMHFRNIDHSFIVIGRAAFKKAWAMSRRADEPESFDVKLTDFREVNTAPTDVGDPTTWGPDAVICDPWHDKVYAAKDFQAKMYRGTTNVQGVLQPSLVMRIE